MRKSVAAAVAVLALGLTTSASAVPVTFDLGSDSSVAITEFSGGWLCSLTDCGAVVTLNPHLGSLTRTLNAGEQWTFDFFSVRLHGLGGGTGDLFASLAFDAPTSAGNAEGGGNARFFTGFVFSAGDLIWNQPGNFSLADGTSYSVFFEDLMGITLGTRVNVRATLALNSEPVGVPEPGMLGLLGLGMLGIGFAKRRRAARS